MQKLDNIREETQKASIMQNIFSAWKELQYLPGLVKNIDICIVHSKNKAKHFLWGEAKKDNIEFDLMLTQLILTIQKAIKGATIIPPKVICCVNANFIWFVPYSLIQKFLNITDVDWTCTPSNYKGKGFLQLNKEVKKAIDCNKGIYQFSLTEMSKIKEFVGKRIISTSLDEIKIDITHNNFVGVFHQWEKKVLPSIKISKEDWKELSKDKGLVPNDLFLAGLFTENGETQVKYLRVIFEKNGYTVKHKNSLFDSESRIEFADGGVAATQFWECYKRPPKEEFWKQILNRKDLLVSQGDRAMGGAFYTPDIFVHKAVEYITNTLGEKWQDEYYVYDCAAGTGNLLQDLINPEKVFASTKDESDVRIMHGNIKRGESKLYENNIFQFDFLKDDIKKMPKHFQAILKDKKKREKLIFFINPPWGEAGNKKSVRTGERAKGGIQDTSQNDKLRDKFGGKAMKDVQAQFLSRIYNEFGGCIIAEFSKLKILQAPDSSTFRDAFKAELKSCFVVPANTFENVTGKFPVGFKIWDTKSKKRFSEFDATAFDKDGNELGKKTLHNYDNEVLLNKMNPTNKAKNALFYLRTIGADFQNQNDNYIMNCKNAGGKWNPCNDDNAEPLLVEHAVRHSVEATWLNDRDNFLFPKDTWKGDKSFIADCCIWAMLNNFIDISKGENHLNPYSAKEVGSGSPFGSKFGYNLVIQLELTEQGKQALEAGAELNKHYYKQQGAVAGASIADIRRFFKKGKQKSQDEVFNKLNAVLTEKCNDLQSNIRIGTYKHRFLLE
ncbi:MAG: N-6 DNA methylase [Fibromonadales bacterium]|nr:N-6 DNA methylase [Fibromonadales bacterium]